jgi:hypothetical protein
MEALFIFSAAVALMVIGTVWRGYVFSVLWKWFIVPVFPAMPLLSIPVAIGIAMVVSFLSYQYQHNKDERSAVEQFSSAIGITLLYPALALLVGWIVTLFL